MLWCVVYRSSSTETNALCCSGCIFAYINGMYLPHPQTTNKQTRSTHPSPRGWGTHNTLCTSMLSAPGGVVPYGASSASSFNARSRTPFNNSNALSHHGQSSRINIVMRPILHVYCISAALVCYECNSIRRVSFCCVDAWSNSPTSTVTEGLTTTCIAQ